MNRTTGFKAHVNDGHLTLLNLWPSGPRKCELGVRFDVCLRLRNGHIDKPVQLFGCFSPCLRVSVVDLSISALALSAQTARIPARRSRNALSPSTPTIPIVRSDGGSGPS